MPSACRESPGTGCHHVVADMEKANSLLLVDYAEQIKDTDVLDDKELAPVVKGLFGEVGGIMATSKKHVRENRAYPGYRRAAEEEFGDTLWYLAAICRRLNIPLQQLFEEASNHGQFKGQGAASDIAGSAFALIATPAEPVDIDTALIRLGQAAASLLISHRRDALVAFARAYLDALNITDLTFASVARGNLSKARGAFTEPQPNELKTLDFDCDFAKEEQLPREFEIRIIQRASGRSYLQWREVFIGDPLMDNIADPDGYRFHDVFHLAYAAILHWSPVTRALIKHKRKSRPEYDEEQDSGRAIVVEEGLTAWIFSRAKELDFFAGQDRVSFGILKTIAEFVSGYEVERCPLKLWERAILDGYTVFRQVRENQGGLIIGDRAKRSIRYEPLPKQ